MTETPPSQTNLEPPTVRNRVKKPAGVLPRNVQTWVILGVALLMIAILALETPRKANTKSDTNLEQATVVDPNARRIQEYRRRIEEHAQKLAAERARLERAQSTMENAEVPSASLELSNAYPQSQPPPRVPEKSAIQKDREERAYRSLFASNLALSYRQTKPTEVRNLSHTAAPMPPLLSRPSLPFTGPAVEPPFPFYSFPAGPALPLQSPALPIPNSAESAAETRNQPEVQKAEPAAPNQDSLEQEEAGFNSSTGKKYRLFEGTVLEAVLTNRLTGSFSGPVNCMLTGDVYSHDRQKLLIPKGSRVLGEVRQVEHLGQERLAVVFHRIIMPDGFSLSLDQFQGLNQIGETGLKDKVNRHYFKIFGVSLAIGAIAGLAQAGTRYGDTFSSEDAYRQGVSRSVAASSMRILDRFLNVLPTFTIREGHRIKIYLSGDLLVPAYENHLMPDDL